MAELTAFSYRPGASLLHGFDIRFKLAFLVLVSLASLKAGPWALLVLTFMLVAVIIDTRLPVKSIFMELRYFLVLLFMVFIARALTTPGSPLIHMKGVSVTWEGIYIGSLVCWRLVMIIMAGLLFVSTARSSDIRAAVQWFLAPFPFIPGKRVATMMSLIMRFMPLILDQAKETAEAQRARGIENRKNPLYRLRKFAIPLIRRTFESADRLAVAMEARCYNEQRIDPALSSTRRDWIALLVVLCLCMVIIGS